MRWQHLVAAGLGLAAAYVPTQSQALLVPEAMQPIIHAVGWQPSEVPMLLDVISCESGWNPLAIGAAGELGLLQFKPQTWEGARQWDAEIPPVAEYWSSASAQLYTGRVLWEHEGWEPWSCAR